ncbi:hypothetical protein I4U23_016988 [Adineta vaga]|nr:hypothetical protein I4U23_016988 [Adineta vaga]
MTLSSFKAFVTQRGGRRNGPCAIILILMSYFCAVVGLIFGINELRQLTSYVERNCQVTSVDVIRSSNKKGWSPAWNIIVLGEGSERTTEVKDRMIMDNAFNPKKLASLFAEKKEIDQIYPCYRHRDHPSAGTWGWQWTKPSTLKACSYLFGFLILLILGTALMVLRKIYQRQTNQEREEMELTEPLATPPPPTIAS